MQGSITANNMEGLVLANTVQGDINVTFKELNDEKELSPVLHKKDGENLTNV